MKLKIAESRLQSRKDMEELLLKKCEALQSTMFEHRSGEQTATLELKKANRNMKVAETEHKATVAQLEAQLRDMGIHNRKLEVGYTQLANKIFAMEKR